MITNLRNDWKNSLERAIDLCLQRQHIGDASTVRDILEWLSKPEQAAIVNTIRKDQP